MRDALRTCLQIAGGLTEATRRRAVGTAHELLGQVGVDVEAVQRKIGESIPPEVHALADELVAAGRANRDLLLGLIREEVDKTMDRVSWVADEVTKVGVILEALERRVRNLEGGGAGEAAPAAPVALPRERVRVDGEGRGGPAMQKAGTEGAVKRVVPVTTVSRTTEAKEPEAKKAPAPAGKSAATAKKATTRKAAVAETAGGLAPAARAAAKRVAAMEGEVPVPTRKKAVPAKKAVSQPKQAASAEGSAAAQLPGVEKAPAKKTAGKKTAGKKTAGKKTAGKKTPAKKTAMSSGGISSAARAFQPPQASGEQPGAGDE